MMLLLLYADPYLLYVLTAARSCRLAAAIAFRTSGMQSSLCCSMLSKIAFCNLKAAESELAPFSYHTVAIFKNERDSPDLFL